MRKIKILHCADLHFDTPFRELDKEVAENSRLELLEVFKNIIDLTITENVEVLLIAGDVFDNLTVNKNTLFFIAKELNRINNVHVFISPGNHDPYNNKSFYNMIEWPENVVIFHDEFEKKEIADLNLVVWGAGFKDKYENNTLLKKYNVDSSKINIMVIHGEISEGNSSNEYNPMYLTDIRNSNMEYIALGHRHKFSGILKEGLTNYAYSGCPQGRGFDEEDEKGIIIGDIFKGGVSLTFKSICIRRYITKEVYVDEVNTYDELMIKIVNEFNEEQRKRNFYKIILKGVSKAHFNINENILKDKLKSYFYYIKIINKTEIEVELDKLSNGYSLKGRYLTKIKERIEVASDEDKEILKLALKIGLQAMSEEEVNLNDY